MNEFKAVMAGFDAEAEMRVYSSGVYLCIC